jgi:iron complex transport system ATP-binding protein
VNIEARNISVRYGATTAVAGVDLSMWPGVVVGVIGPNGSGKSSLVKAIAGVVASTGDIRFDGSRVRPASIGYMAQDIGGRAALTVLEVVLLGRLRNLGLRVGKADLALVEQVLARLQIQALAGRHLGELSGGQRQLVLLAQALASEPRALLLDEPISALDLNHQLHVLATVCAEVRRRGLSGLVVLHDLNAVLRFADEVVVMNGGRMIARGVPAAVLTPDLVRDVFQIEPLIERASDGFPFIIGQRAVGHAGVRSR